MGTGIRFTILIVCTPLLAQWPTYPTPNVPKTAEGKPNLSGPAPKTANGKPDLSGVWQYQRPPEEANAAPPAPPAPGTTPDIIPLAIRRSQFWNLGASFKDGLPFQPWAAELHRKRVEENSKDNPDAHCLPLGVMQLHTHGQPRKIIQTPNLTVIVYEANSGLRQIFTDGRPMPKDVEPWWYGYSVGKWEGDTFVVESAHFRDLGWLDVEGSPLTDTGRIIERMRRPDFGHLVTEVTIDDPRAYTRPWTVTIHHRLMLDTDLIEFVCQENDKAGPHLVGK
ncbi:MAG TPA: hypothetical protein VG297_18005 [Bryobacteraceae bacterium]|jgi:hypothetical protein|nr:hypothetical protein [Bryobacteraceae bacterium]